MDKMTNLDANKVFSARLSKGGAIHCVSESMIHVFDNISVKAMKDGEMKSICSDGYDGFVIKTKVGMFSMFRLYDGNVHYRAENSLALCSSWKRHGLAAGGIVETLDQMNHIFEISDSYL